jgi:hypothetical protein
MSKSVTWMVFGLALAGLLVVSAASDVQARPKYMGEFKTAYPKLAEEADKVKCNVCHYGDKKTNRNDYGKAVGEGLGKDAKNVMDAKLIAEALKKAEAGKSSTEGKTFGDLIKEGKLPGKNP